MPDFPTYIGGNRFEDAGANAADSSGTSVTFNGNDAKGSYVALIAATTFQASGLWLSISNAGNGVDHLLDLSFGAVDNEVDVLSNFLFAAKTTGALKVFLPIVVPAGTRLAVRGQTSNASAQTIKVAVTLAASTFMSGGLLGTRITPYGANTADSGGVQIDPGGSANTKGAWVEIEAATDFHHKALMMAVGASANASQSTADFLFDIAVGAGTSEKIIVPNILIKTTTAEQQLMSPAGPYPVEITAGIRLAVRAQSSTIDAIDRLLDVCLYGFS